MIKKIKNRRRIFPTVMLVLIAFVYTLSILCNSGLKEVLFQSHNSHDHNHHDHAHDDHHSHHDHHEHSNNDSENNESEDNCCNKSTSSFFSSFKQNTIHKIHLTKIFFNINYFSGWNKISLNKTSYCFKRFSPQFLKRKIPDIRILIQSFII